MPIFVMSDVASLAMSSKTKELTVSILDPQLSKKEFCGNSTSLLLYNYKSRNGFKFRFPLTLELCPFGMVHTRHVSNWPIPRLVVDRFRARGVPLPSRVADGGLVAGTDENRIAISRTLLVLHCRDGTLSFLPECSCTPHGWV